MIQMIQSIIDNDLYKFTMQQAAFQLYRTLSVEYQFTDRRDMEYTDQFVEQFNAQVQRMSELRLQRNEERYLLQQLGHILTAEYLDFLSNFRFDPSQVSASQVDGELKIFICGPLVETILWEVPLLAIISELKTSAQLTKEVDYVSQAIDRTFAKGLRLKQCGAAYSEFGTRRRASFEIQKAVFDTLRQFPNCSGSSNVYLAYLSETLPIGTMAHEWIMLHAALHGWKTANTHALNSWQSVYGVQLGIALPDTFTTDHFFTEFDSALANSFSGLRQDSGDPVEFLEKTLAHYAKLNIESRTKTLIFSDGLNVDKVIELHRVASPVIHDSYGLGTHFTNDLPGIQPPNIVIKLRRVMTASGPVECVKLSDTPGKHTGDSRTLSIILNDLRCTQGEKYAIC